MSPVTPESEYWRSTGHLEKSPESQEHLHREFPVDASVLEDGMSRRTFIKLMGATAAIAGLAGAGCSLRRPEKGILPFAKSPEDLIPGKTTYFATTHHIGEEVVGVLAENFEGRPIKIEGNLEHSQSLGKIKSLQQASVLELYDPDRLKKVRQGNDTVAKKDFVAWLAQQKETFKAKKGQGLAILTETQVSPTFYRLAAALKEQLPEAKLYRYEPINEDHSREGLLAATGKHVQTQYRLDKARIIASFASDFLGTDRGSIVYTQQFTSRRDPDQDMNRLYVFEGRLSLTGGKADHRLALTPAQAEWALFALAKELGSSVSAPQADAQLKAKIAPMIKALASDLTQNKGQSVILVGETLSPAAHALAAVLNQQLGNIGSTVRYTEIPFSGQAWSVQSNQSSIRALSAALDAGQVETLIILGSNPVYTAPADLNFGEKLSKVAQSVHVSLFENDTTEKTKWAVPRSHYLEAWGDAKSSDGTQSLVQPLIAPLYDSVSDIDVLSILVDGSDDGYLAVQKTWGVASDLDRSWRRWLHNGVIRQDELGSGSPSSSAVTGLSAKYPIQLKEEWVLITGPSYSIYDGRFANNGWLQELPDPVTKLTWDNAVLINSKTAKKLGVNTGDKIRMSAQKRTLDAAVLIVPGIADSVMYLSQGYGQGKVGRVGEGTGFNVNQILTQNASVVSGVAIEKISGTYKFALTQEHGLMEGRAIYRQAELAAFKKDPEFAKKMVEHPPLVSPWEEKKYESGYQWGMVIDLAKCTGCSACITACQAENNIPIVGKDQVALSREMHWIRIDRYFEGPENNPQMVQQPVTCLHCEMAPCEQVCPVAATTHSEEGLNEMTYNRCVGTRYCANNCPVKVRRFNFFDFHQRNPQAVEKSRVHLFDYFKEPDKTVKMQFNPDVTVRMRGVMEKCTYCVQRINKVKIDAKNEDRTVKDGEIQTACQQTCPANAIVFGDSLNAETEVAKLKKSPRDYHLLSELNLKARTSYLAGIRNPNPTLDRVKG
jgi:MoCo/4Fe-4S cofactor protein with predicted Tat translocation signal